MKMFHGRPIKGDRFLIHTENIWIVFSIIFAFHIDNICC